jgi:hypothetical protein
LLYTYSLIGHISDACFFILIFETVCRKCIYKKITDEELESCPVCDTELGCSPLEKLRYLIISFSYDFQVYATAIFNKAS